ncbi:MAG: hypothetical protein ACFHHU_00380 [Porticoccaceae bacterium]
MAVFVSFGELVSRKTAFTGTAVAKLTDQVEGAINNLCNAVTEHYGVKRAQIVHTDDHAVLCPMTFDHVPEEIRFGEDDRGINILCFLIQHDVINSRNITSAATALVEQLLALGECLATHFSVRFVDFSTDYALELEFAATFEGQKCPPGLQAFDMEGELVFSGSAGQGE